MASELADENGPHPRSTMEQKKEVTTVEKKNARDKAA